MLPPLDIFSGALVISLNVFSAYIARVKKNTHVVLAFSPVGDSFRNRLRMFPSLVNCCTIDWFHEWPAEALYSVAKQQLNNMANAGASAGDLQAAATQLSVQATSDSMGAANAAAANR